MKNLRIFLSSVLAFSLVWSINGINPAYADAFSTSFEASEGYSLGTLDGQNGWAGDGSYQVNTDNPYTGSQNVTVSDGNIHWRQIGKSFTPQTQGDVIFYMAERYDDRYASAWGVAFNSGGSQVVNNGFPSFAMGWFSKGSYWGSHAGQITFGVNTSNGWVVHDVQVFSAGTYYKIHIKWDTNTGVAAMSVNDGPFVSDVIQGFPIDTYELQFRSSDPNDIAYMDEIHDVPISPAAQITNLITSVESFSLKHGIETSLVAKLQNAQTLLDAVNTVPACNLLTAFIDEVKAQSSRAMTMDQSDQLITKTQEIKSQLSCQ